MIWIMNEYFFCSLNCRSCLFWICFVIEKNNIQENDVFVLINIKNIYHNDNDVYVDDDDDAEFAPTGWGPRGLIIMVAFFKV